MAADGTGVNSPYTLALTEAMRTPGIPAEKMFKLARDRVLEETGGDQTPWEESSLTGADFYFNPANATATTASPGASTAAALRAEELGAERDFWQSIKESNEPATFEAYLEQYPSGTFAILARLRVKQFEKKQTVAVKQQQAEAEAQSLAAEAMSSTASVTARSMSISCDPPASP